MAKRITDYLAVGARVPVSPPRRVALHVATDAGRQTWPNGTSRTSCSTLQHDHMLVEESTRRRS